VKPVRALLPLSWVYGAVAGARNILFDRGLLAVEDAGVPVISVGNLTAGGTGKTPLVEYVVRRLLERGRKPGVVSRGYGRAGRGTVVVADGGVLRVAAAEAGDEPLQIARKFPGAAVVVGERRADAARVAVRACGADVVVMDDGFQHRGLGRDFDLVAVDARTDLRHEPMLPAGLRREPLSGLRRADLVVLTRAEDSGVRGRATAVLRPLFGGPAAAAGTRLTGFRTLDGGTALDSRALAGLPVLLFCGIGSAAAFSRTVAHAGARVVKAIEFPDHHRFGPDDLRRVIAGGREAGARWVVTTEKDACRLAGLPAATVEVLAGAAVLHTVVETEFYAGEELVLGWLDAALAQRRP